MICSCVSLLWRHEVFWCENDKIELLEGEGVRSGWFLEIFVDGVSFGSSWTRANVITRIWRTNNEYWAEVDTVMKARSFFGQWSGVISARIESFLFLSLTLYRIIKKSWLVIYEDLISHGYRVIGNDETTINRWKWSQLRLSYPRQVFSEIFMWKGGGSWWLSYEMGEGVVLLTPSFNEYLLGRMCSTCDQSHRLTHPLTHPLTHSLSPIITCQRYSKLWISA